jgi:lipopolysaccharide transport system ATP-binding protein
MSDVAVRLQSLGKMYKLYRRPGDKVWDALGINRWLFWRKDYYQEFWALRDLNLNIQKGERIGIIGRNGAGKSTLLKIISENIAATEGTVVVNGCIQALLELGTGFHPEFTGRQNIRAFLAYQGLSPAGIRDKEEDIVEFAELEEFIDQPIKTYSGGMYARLAFSTATTIEPDILIIDEILGAGDAYFTGKCLERMRRLTEDSGATVLFVSHDLGSVQRLCSRAIWIDRGRIRQDGEPLHVIKAYSAMTRREEEVRLKARDLKVLKKQAVLLDRHEDIYDKLLFHFVPADGKSSKERKRIYSLSLYVGEELVASIDVGSPLDNSPDYLNYLMDAPGYMSWGPSQKDEYGTYRLYQSDKGRYRHAPFEFSVPKSFSMESKRVRLNVTCRGEETLVVELYNGARYQEVGILRLGDYAAVEIPFSGVMAFSKSEKCPDLDEDLDTETSHLALADKQRDKDSQSEYGSGEARITAVRMLSDVDQEKRVFEVGEPMKLVMEFEAFEKLSNPVFVFCAYLADGQVATQWIVPSEKLGKKSIYGKGSVTFGVRKLLLGKASYVASAAIFKYLRSDGQEAECYHLLDRCMHFQVIQETGDVFERGLCLQPFEAELWNELDHIQNNYEDKRLDFH